MLKPEAAEQLNETAVTDMATLLWTPLSFEISHGLKPLCQEKRKTIAVSLKN